MRQFIVVGAVIILIFVSVIWLFARGDNKPKQGSKVSTGTTIVDYANTDVAVRFTEEGKINARENHRVLQITVSQSERTITLFDGFQGSVLKNQTFLNDQDSYRALLAGLQNSGYTKTQIVTKNVNPIASCPNGKRFRYDIVEGANLKQSLWSSTCSSTKGTFAGRSSEVQTLFRNQIPDYSSFVKGVNF